MVISQEAIDLIITEEDSDEATYARHYTGFDWPGGASGPTVGIGYDCGYCTADDMDRDWGGLLSPDQIAMLKKASGLTHIPAESFVNHYRHMVNIPWLIAIEQFTERELPKWIDRVTKNLPNCDRLHPHSLGALVSLAYNRGCSFQKPGDRYVEMRNIYQHMVTKVFGLIPSELTAMRRLWPPAGSDLWMRREHEATLFVAGLQAQRGLSIPA